MPIDSIEYYIPVAHFRGQMDRLLAMKSEIFQIHARDGQSREYRISYYPTAHTSTREVWNILPIIPVVDGKRASNSRFAMVLAVEDTPGRTIVEFLDGRCYERIAYHFRSSSSEPTLGNAHLAFHDPIGDDFIELSNILKDKLLPQIKKERDASGELWERIPNKKWYRKALKLWHENLTAKIIASRLGISEGRIYNLFSNLRKKYGDEIVPRHK